ncbi:HAD family hydrolase [Reichenbachiella ulvae]|uniref:HAD family phosphatase n=1 Tax=Reichenbachiella ulvae TaxID=2980104 RepID=A0ABT3CSF9_9BACT|nr:HAD family phosphatase [Reichenbachiella ulvae]MCV9386498.1 HAD family phosphatase [Reichenbachiella ulvae]
MNIKAIIFDLGGVIINLDEVATVKAFAELANHSVEQVMQHYQISDAFKQYEMGLISSEAFRQEIRTMMNTEATDSAIDQAWNAMLGAIPIERLQLMLDLQQNYEVMVLSNTNEIHEQAFNQTLRNVSGKNSLHDFAHQVYFSHRLNLRKPNKDIYEEVLRQSGFEAKDCIFLDDKKENLIGAESVGLHTFHVATPNDIFKITEHV